MFEDWIEEERPKINIWMALSRGEARELLRELAHRGEPVSRGAREATRGRR